jgi:diguanylate cyclase (GGDEF)-like protein
MLADKNIVKLNEKSPSMDCLSHLIQEASGLQVLTHRFALLTLMANEPTRNAIARPLQVRQVLHEVMASWSKLRSSEFNFPGGRDTEFAQTMRRAFSPENERVINCFETMAQSICAFLGHGRVLSPADLTELVRFVSHELTETNKSILSAARMVDNLSRKQAEKLALTDILTGLPNRRALYEFLSEHGATEWRQDQVTVTHVDLDNFKAINDSLGHAAGDAALQHAAGAIMANSQLGDLLARVGGDEFVLISIGNLEEDGIAARAKSLINDISKPFLYADRICKIEASAGIALGLMDDIISIDQCILNADMALYDAKNAGRGTFRFFTPILREQSVQRDDLVAQIREGIDLEQFEPFFQPQVEGRTGQLVGLEALARWRHPTRGTLTPFHFLDVARDAGLLEELDNYLMARAFVSMQGWITRGIRIPQISINLTSARLLEVDLVEAMLAAVRKADLSPSMIGVEILESAMIDDNSQQMAENIRGLAEVGFKLELDDFGTGHASISNLKNFKVDRIKIDRSFVKDVHLNTDLSKITGAMISLAHSLRVDALAEGVETPEERLVLNALGCDHFQGYGVSHPLPALEIPNWVSRTQNTQTLPPRQKRKLA